MDMLKRYHELYDDMRTSKNPAKMMIFGEAEVWAFEQVAEKQPRIAEMWLDKLEATHWHNYLSKAEADEIAATIVNQNGSRGAHWTYDTFRGVIESLGGKMNDEPYYNCYALWITANMIYSDHAQSIAEDMGFKAPSEVPNEKIALSCYKKSIEKLKDTDRPRFVREYFHV